MSKKIIIDGVIGWDIYASKVRSLLEDADGDEINIDIASPGGFVYDGLEIFNLIRDYSRNKNKVTIKLTGLAASMASYIALAGDRIVAEDNAVFMIHNVWSMAVGDYREMQKEAKTMEGLTNLLAKAYSKKTKKPMKEIRDLMDNETFYFGKEMVDAGFVDEIVKTGKNESKDEVLLLAKGRIENCFAVMEKSERSKHDMKKVASIIPIIEPQSSINSYDANAKLIDEEWSKTESETRWRNHADVNSSEDLPNATYKKRFVYFDSENQENFGAYKFPIWDFKNGEFVNVSAVRNGLARLSNSDIPSNEKDQARTVLEKYLNRYNEDNAKMEEKKNMDEKEFKALEIENAKLKAEIENIKAHLEFADIAPKEVLNAIKNNEEFSQKISVAKYSKIQAIAELKLQRDSENVDPLNIKPKDTTVNAEDTKAYTDELKKQWGLK